MDLNETISISSNTTEIEENMLDGDTKDGYPDFLAKIKHKKKKPIPMASEKDAFYYNTNFNRRGIAIIFNHENFDIDTLKSRSGTEADCSNLHNVLFKLDFEVRKYLDLTVQQLKTVVNEVSGLDHTDCYCFLMVILSHGEHGIIYAKDTAFKLDVLMDQFTPDKCPSLAGKPKIFLIQACQGDRLDPGVELGRIQAQVDADIHSYRIPLYADFLIAYSTIPGFYSWRNTHKGSWFIQAFCEEITLHGTKYDLLTILTNVSRKVAIDFESNVPDNRLMHKQKQIPCVTSMLTRIVKFDSKIDS